MRPVVLVVLCVPWLLPGARAQSDRPVFPLQFVDTEAASSSGLHVADVDADGDVDILTAAIGQLTVLLGDGHGYFPQKASTSVASFTLGMTVGDIDLDGYPDVALSSGTEDGVAILIGAGNGYFGQQASVVPVGHDPAEPVLGDFDGDGDLDLAVVRTPAGTLAVALGDGSGGFGPVASYATASTSARDLAVADLDLDQDLDLVVAFGAFAGLQVFRGDGRGGFLGEPALAAPNPCSDVLAADVTGDGRPDLVGCMNNAAAVTMLAGQPGGVFAAAQPWGPSVGGIPHSLAAGDIDGDGDVDIAVGTALSFDVDSVKWLINAGGSSASLVLTPAGYEIGPVALADVNGDGLTDLLTASADSNRGVTVVLNALDPLLEAPGQLAIPPLSVRALDSGDVDGDGAEELVALGTIAGGLVHVVAVAVPDLAIVAETELNVSGTLPGSIWCGDLDGDGRDDLAVPDVSADKIVVVHGQSGGGFGSHVVVATSLDPDFVVGGDVDGDGDFDLVTASRFHDAVAVVWNDGAGDFSAPLVLAVPDAPVEIDIADLDQDGNLDLCVAHAGSSGSLSLLFGVGNHAFEAPAPLPVGGQPADVQVADLDLDGDADLAVATAPFLRLFQGLGGGSFAAGPVNPGGAQSWIDIGDVDGDELPDIVTDGSGGGVGVVYAGAGGLAPTMRFNCQNWDSALLLDADADGLLDLVLGGNSSQAELEFHWNVSDQSGPLENVGQGLAGSNGTPHWSGLGTLQPSMPLALKLAYAKPVAPLTLILGFSVLDAPFKGGTLVPQPQILLAGLMTNAAGKLTLTAIWPAGIPSDFLLATQCWIVDPAGPAGLSASNGLVFTAP